MTPAQRIEIFKDRYKCIYETNIIHAVDGNLLTVSDLEALLSERKEMLLALNLILPLAGGYVMKNDVGSNRKYLNIAKETLDKAEGKEQ